ncbi:hypothetical protein GCM10025883_09070 [Mobilicoccus caccae]|uniref:Uncharacterized protein n=1 Tax=Mobilicoccus caccae TaxID=1859295 RepID=A0ABQ6ILR1_9MICO|nr:hypothetical protein GCM10025883_09070 [Mobilicoccus caccae]
MGFTVGLGVGFTVGDGAGVGAATDLVTEGDDPAVAGAAPVTTGIPASPAARTMVMRRRRDMLPPVWNTLPGSRQPPRGPPRVTDRRITDQV